MSTDLQAAIVEADAYRDEVCRLVAEHLATYVVPLMPSEVPFAIPSPEQMRASTLAHEARALALYAITGRDGETDEPAIAAEYAWDRAREVTLALDSAPSGEAELPDTEEGRRWSQHEATHSYVELAHARGILAGLHGGTLTSPQLAALAGVSPQYVRTQVAAGEIRATLDASRPGRPAHRIAPDEARRWLSGRGVQV